jgi:very-long-chain enoyl-CoA reductase
MFTAISIFSQIAPTTSIEELKKHVHKLKSKLHPDRQALRLEVRGKTLKDSDKLDALNVRDGGKIYCKDLGPQIGWKTVFLAEYAGPLLVYLMFYNRPEIIYGQTGKMISETTQ